MESFDIGWVPEGWVKGHPLDMQNERFLHGDMAALLYVVQSLGEGLPTIGAVQFHVSEHRKVNAWLKWWYGAQARGE